MQAAALLIQNLCGAKLHHRRRPSKLSEGWETSITCCGEACTAHGVFNGGNYNYLTCSGLRPLSLHHPAFLAMQAHDKAICQQKITHTAVWYYG